MKECTSGEYIILFDKALNILWNNNTVGLVSIIVTRTRCIVFTKGRPATIRIPHFSQQTAVSRSVCVALLIETRSRQVLGESAIISYEHFTVISTINQL